MAVVETGAIFNSLIFGGINSVDYGIYITGEAVYNAPVRAVEMVSVPGRNGAIAIDQGYWENVEVTYPAGCFGTTQTEFAEAIASFRNAIVSQLGYQRLTDTYHPEEYRMATYISGLEVEAVNMGVAGEFELVFNAKPQRWLTSGEEVISATSGSVIPNPTLYSASPMVEVEGYGTVTLGDYEVEITNEVLGEVTLFSKKAATSSSTVANIYTTRTFDSSYVSSGDTITMSSVLVVVDSTKYYASFGAEMYFTYPSDATTENGDRTATNLTYYFCGYGSSDSRGKYMGVDLFMDATTFTAGTASEVTGSLVITNDVTYESETNTCQFTVTLTLSYDGDSTITATLSRSIDSDPAGIFSIYGEERLLVASAVADSTVSILGTPTYIDCDLGVCYKIEDSSVVDLNSYIDLGSDLPVLSPGDNDITFDDTITSVDIIPRWWQL